MKQHTATHQQHLTRLAKLMRISWEIQYRRKCNRSKSLLSAWAILLNEEITVHHLVRKHSHERYANKVDANTLTLFPR